MHSEKRLYLVFEYLDLDLKKHMDSCPEFGKDLRMIKLNEIFLLFEGLYAYNLPLCLEFNNFKMSHPIAQ